MSNGLGLDGTFARFNNYEVNARYALTPALSLAGSYTYTAGFLDGRHPGWNQFNLQTDYALSKRTDVYVQGVYQRVSTDGYGHRRLCQWPRWCFIDQQADRGHSRPAPSLLSDR